MGRPVRHRVETYSNRGSHPVATNESNLKPKIMSHYVDGFVIPIPKDKIETYRQIAEEAGKIWKEHGALEYYECVGDDLDVKDLVPFPRLAGAKPDETVAFSWILFKSREHRDEVNKKVINDPRLGDMMKEGAMPFDTGRMAYGGFKPIVKL
jgi:uncharacterized protein YbaA (DUF1428 family)